MARPCPRLAARLWKTGERWMVPVSQPPCLVRFPTTGEKVLADGARVSHIGPRVVLDANARVFTSDRFGTVAIWKADGSLERAFGRSGAGPGELAPGLVVIAPARDRSVHVFDNAGRWHRFREDGSLIRTVQFSGTRDPMQIAALDDGRLLDASGRDADSVSFLLWSSLRADVFEAPRIAARFGPLNAEERRTPWTNRGRLIAYRGGETFWAGPPRAVGRGYELEEWHVDGRRLRTLRREAPWFPRGADRAPSRVASGAKPPHEIESIWDLGDERLLVIVLAPKSGDWRVPVGRVLDPARRDQLLSIWAEILDTRSGTLLATLGPLTYSQAVAQLPMVMAPGTHRGVQLDTTADGERYVRRVTMELTAR